MEIVFFWGGAFLGLLTNFILKNSSASLL